MMRKISRAAALLVLFSGATIVLCGCGPKIIPSTPSRIRILILSKYMPDRISLLMNEGDVYIDGMKESAVIEHGDISKRRNLSLDGVYTISLHGDILQIHNEGKIRNASHILLKSSEPIRLSFEKSGNKIEKYYSDTLEFEFADNSIRVINELSLEKYAALTSYSESGEIINSSLFDESPSSRENFIKAVEITIRSWAAAERSRHKADNADLCDLTHCMHYGGEPAHINKIKPLADNLVLLADDGKVLHSYFHSSCGGSLSGPEVFWKNHEPEKYFRRSEDGESGKYFCEKSPHFHWSSYVEKKTLEETLSIHSIREIQTQTKNNRVSDIRITYSDHKIKIIPISQFLSAAGRKLGWNAIKSNKFSVQKDYNGFKFTGSGLGHGVGLCQWGAFRQALDGRDFKEILLFYYPHSELAEIKYE